MSINTNNLEQQSTEKWAGVPDWDNYECSTHGRVRSLGRGMRTEEGRILKGNLGSSPYLVVSLSHLGYSRQFCIHKLVALCFIPNPGDKPFVNHIDGIKRNNQLENLEWCTRRENVDHAMKLGLISRGEKHPNAKLNFKKAQQILALRESGASVTEIGILFGVSRWAVYHCLNKVTSWLQ